MSNEKKDSATTPDIKTIGTLAKDGVKISDKGSIDALTQRGYGTAENSVCTLAFYEALFLLDKQMLQVREAKGAEVTFQSLLKAYEGLDENAWVRYLVYRDLRSRGYVVREGFGAAIDFRIYERGAYGKDTAQFLVASTQEGKPMLIEDLANVLTQSQSLKKELIFAVINRRGEIVYYSVAPLTFK